VPSVGWSSRALSLSLAWRPELPPHRLNDANDYAGCDAVHQQTVDHHRDVSFLLRARRHPGNGQHRAEPTINEHAARIIVRAAHPCHRST
jgi:hypothetical protein